MAYIGGNRFIAKKPDMFDGTSIRELNKALSTYLNAVGPGDYNLKSLTGTTIMETHKRNMPLYSVR